MTDAFFYKNFIIYNYKIIKSTQDKIYQLAQKNYTSPIIVISKSQTNARGRFNRKWISSNNGLYFSILYRQTDIFKYFNIKTIDNFLNYLPFYPALALVEFLQYFKINSFIKWPNDIIFDDKKIAGILIEKKQDFYIIGIGFNIKKINLSSAISLEEIIDLSYYDFSNIDFLKLFLDCFEKICRSENIINLTNKYLYAKNKYAFYKNKKVIIKKINPNGSLLVKEGLKEFEIISGEIFPQNLFK